MCHVLVQPDGFFITLTDDKTFFNVTTNDVPVYSLVTCCVSLVACHLSRVT